MDNREMVIKAANHFGVELSPNWCGIDAVWPLLEMMRADGAVVIVKLDGERTGVEDNGPYTFMSSWDPPGGGFARVDTASVDDGLAYIIAEYAMRVWKLDRLQ